MTPLHPRANIVRNLLDNGMVRVIVDADHQGCVVPAELKRIGGPLHLNLSYRFEGHDMSFEPDALHVTLSFDGGPFRCVLPWSSLIAAANLPREKAEEQRTKASHLRVLH